MNYTDKSKDKLKDDIRKEVTHLFEKTLDYAQVACPNKETFRALRSRILRMGNDCIRKLHTRLDNSYDVNYITKSEDVIEIKR